MSVHVRHGWAAEAAEMRHWYGLGLRPIPLAPAFPVDILVLDAEGSVVEWVEVKSSTDRWHAHHPTLTDGELGYAQTMERRGEPWTLARYRGRTRLFPWGVRDYEADLKRRAARRAKP